MSEIYQVRVLKIAGDRLTCRVTALQPREPKEPPASKTLALMLLWEPWHLFSEGLYYAFQPEPVVTLEQAKTLGRTAPIGRELAGRDICDGDWMRANVGRFIRKVEVRGRRVVEEQPQTIHVRATFVITVTDPRWLKHLRAGMEWGTAAYNRDEKD